MKIRLAIIGAMLALTTACTYVPPGHVGVRVNLLGSDKGVDHDVIPVGRYWKGWNQEFYLFPTFTQNYVWTKSMHEGRQGVDESISFQTQEGLEVNADVGISYHIDPNKVSAVFQKYRRGVDEITDTFLRNMVRDSLVKESGSLAIESVYGNGKSELIAKVQDDVKNQVQDIGIIIEKVYWIGNLRLPETVTEAINAKIKATQMAQQRENEVAQAKAEADKQVATAKGEADSKLLVATAEAQAIKIKGDALAKNPDLIRLMAVEKWDGNLPRITGGAMPFIQADAVGQVK